MTSALFLLPFLLLPATAFAAGDAAPSLELAGSGFGLFTILVFIIAYGFVVVEEFLHLRKSKPVILGAGFIWIAVALGYAATGDTHTPEVLFKDALLHYGELLLFLLAAMTYVNTMSERGLFDALRAWLVSRGCSFPALFWITGVISFFASGVLDNLTTTLIMGAVVTTVGAGQPHFVALGCINVVVAANAGGAFTPFGDITTLMVWQHGILPFEDFFVLFIPSLANWLVPATFMFLAVPRIKPEALAEQPRVKSGGFVVLGLFFLTIAIAVSMHNFLHLPPMLGMMTGLGLLKIYGYFIRREELMGWSAASEIEPPLTPASSRATSPSISISR